MKISEVMTSSVETVSADQTAREAANFMLRADAGSIPVCDGDKVIGIITDRDIAVRGVAEGHGPDTPVRDLMSDGIICAHEDDNVDEVAKRMSDEQVRRLPVLDSDERLVGIVSLGDLARGTPGETAHEALEGVSAQGGQHQQG
ncbi:MAG TPA: CBS domain-containing protein [Sphingomicrobium sp.]|nr:CBS domain-containing protein [Sphingomicrobium sp.]